MNVNEIQNYYVYRIKERDEKGNDEIHIWF